MSKMIKKTISIRGEYLKKIDDYLKDKPHTNRSEFMVDCTLQIIEDSYSLSITRKRNILPHLAELSNLTNELENSPIKEAIQREVHSLWLSLK